MRPSEASALRVKSVSLATKKIHVGVSRSLRAEAATKTIGAVRTFMLPPRTVEVLRPLVERRGSEEYLFTNSEGGPVDQANIYKIFVAVQKNLGVAPVRDLYATKDTFISISLTSDGNITWLSEQAGVDEKTLRKHYGRFIHAEESDRLQLSRVDPDYRPAEAPRDGRTADSQTDPDGGKEEFAPQGTVEKRRGFEIA